MREGSFSNLILSLKPDLTELIGREKSNLLPKVHKAGKTVSLITFSAKGHA